MDAMDSSVLPVLKLTYPCLSKGLLKTIDTFWTRFKHQHEAFIDVLEKVQNVYNKTATELLTIVEKSKQNTSETGKETSITACANIYLEEIKSQATQFQSTSSLMQQSISSLL